MREATAAGLRPRRFFTHPNPQAPLSDQANAGEAPAEIVRAKTVTAFDGVPDGLVIPKHFNEGDEVEGDLAAVAIREGWAVSLNAPATPKPPEPAALDKLTNAELIELAKTELDLVLDPKSKKADMIAAIEAARAAKAQA
jgi:hypothetical protein